MGQRKIIEKMRKENVFWEEIKMQLITEILSYPFMVRALVVGILVSVCAAFLGVSMVLKRYSMIGDGLSHVGFAALAIATALNFAPLKVAIPVCILAAFLLLHLSENSKIKGDAAVAILCSGSLAVGVMVISLTSGANTDVYNYMFGSILAVSEEDAALSIILSIAVLILFVLFYHRIFAVTFDETFTKATGTRTGLYNMVLAALTAVTVVLGMKIMGALLISSLIIFPALTSMRICKRYKMVMLSSVIISVICFVSGMILSYEKSTPTGASIVCMNLFVFLVCSVFSMIRKRGGN